MTHATNSTPPTLREIPGFAFLRAPAGGDAPAERAVADDPQGASPPQPATTRDRDVPAPQPAQIASLLQLWLEAFQGRRTVESLRRGPFAPVVLDALSTRVRSHTAGVAAKIMSLHIVPSTPGLVRFCASARLGNRIRAVTGVLVVHSAKTPAALHEVRLGRVKRKRYWRVETISMV